MKRSRTGSAGAAEDEIHPLAETRAHWSLFFPAVAVAALYGGVWLYLDFAGQRESALARVAFLVLAVAPPVLIGYAFLRYYSTGLAVTRDDLLVARGWPYTQGEQIPLAEILSVTVRVSPLARLLGAGSARILLEDGSHIDVNDLAMPEETVEIVRARLHAMRDN